MQAVDATTRTDGRSERCIERINNAFSFHRAHQQQWERKGWTHYFGMILYAWSTQYVQRPADLAVRHKVDVMVSMKAETPEQQCPE